MPLSPVGRSLPPRTPLPIASLFRIPPPLPVPIPPRPPQIATAYSDQIGAESLMEMFESFKLYEGLFYYLGAIVNNSTEPNVHFRYIEAAAKMQQFKEVERVCRDSTVYEAEKVRDGGYWRLGYNPGRFFFFFFALTVFLC